MNQDDIIRMALEAGFDEHRGNHPVGWGEYPISNEVIERFAALVAAAEREACAVIAFNAKTYIEAANAIRARRSNV